MRFPVRIVISDTAKLYPPLWGGPKRIWNLFKHFPEDKFDITYVGIDCELKKLARKYSVRKIKDNFREISSALPAHHLPWYVFEKKVLKNTTFDIFTYLFMNTDREFKSILNAPKQDIFVGSHPWAFPCLGKNSSRLVIYDAHNCEYLLMRQILKGSWLSGLVCPLVAKIEREACAMSDIILVCSSAEKKNFIDLYGLPADKIHVVPNGACVRPVTETKDKLEAKEKLGMAGKKTVVFVGAYYRPNIEALNFIARELAPYLEEYHFLLAGTAADSLHHAGGRRNITLFGGVNDVKLEQILQAADIAVNPMFNGSGVNIKMLDYMSYGLPVVTTECGARGIEVSGSCPFIVSAPEGFALNIKKLSFDEQLCRRLSRDGRALIAQRYDWQTISSRLEAVIEGSMK
ncbi:MAG: glycosyltransferase family 4 protein [Candidatus Omnitrophota bacterium]